MWSRDRIRTSPVHGRYRKSLVVLRLAHRPLGGTLSARLRRKVLVAGLLAFCAIAGAASTPLGTQLRRCP